MHKPRKYQGKSYEELIDQANSPQLTREQMIALLMEDLLETEDYLARRRARKQPWTETDERLIKKQPALAQALAWLKKCDQQETEL